MATVFALALAAGGPAQEAAPDPLPVLVLQNLAPEPRREGAAVVVPFAEGAVKDLPDLHVADTVTAWQPFGLRWPDGSLRQAICLFPVSIDALAELRVPLRSGAGPAAPSGQIAMPSAAIEFVLRRGDAVDRVEATRVQDLEHNALRRVELRRARLAGLVIELLVTAWRDQPHAWVDVAVFFSDPTSPAMQFPIGELAIECRGMALVLRHPGRLCVDQRTTDQGSRTVLVRNDVLADGQGLRRTGVLVPPLRGDGGLADRTGIAACTAPLLGAVTWQASGAFGAFGVVPEIPPWLRGSALRQHLANRHREFVRGDRPAAHPFVCYPLGLGLFPGQTGDQNDFGIVKLSLVAASGLPSLLLEAEASVLQEACRPVHFFEADGAPVDPKRHPDWVVWSGRTHFHPDVSKDRLGKPVPEPPAEYHGWSGKDREHWSSNYLGAFALLSGAHWARRELENEARIYLAGETLDPRLSTSHSGAARGAGRTTLAATWMALSTGNLALLQRMSERLDRTQYPEWAGRELPADRVRPMNVCSPDPRMLLGKAPYWNPWQDSIAAVGFAACHRVTGNPKARELAEALACNAVRHGWLLSASDCQVAVAMRWQDGTPLSAEQLAAGDPTVVTWAHGTAFSDWAFGAVEIARVAATANGDTALAGRAAAIQAAMRGRRRGPPTEPPDQGGIDRFAEWDAVAWRAK
ncbi:MAG: hypothetical protein JNK78_17870 [Planctomycetes bacterium]|nr:hypothetical protein [Planctomycetota bacterium]